MNPILPANCFSYAVPDALYLIWLKPLLFFDSVLSQLKQTAIDAD
jgi:hypothetical protein